MTSKWTVSNIPPQNGRRVVVTGATGGLGYETALALAQRGAEVILAGRNEARGSAAVRGILETAPGATVRFAPLDLADLDSVAAFAGRLLAEDRPLDLLINNAGVMAPPKRLTMAGGFELQFGVNYLSHFALTGRLLPLLRRGRDPRVVQLSSGAHRQAGALDFNDLQWECAYKPWRAYAQSKLAMLLFAFELQRRSDAHGWGILSNAAHPGYARTGLIANGPGTAGFLWKVSIFLQPIMSQSAAAGALPTLLAATSPEAKGGAYYGPDGFLGLKGAPVPVSSAPQARDLNAARQLWEVSETLTGVRWPSGKGAESR